MAVVTLSWQLGCLGDQIAEDAANQLGYKVIGRQELHDMLVNSTDQFSKDLGADEFSKVIEGEIQPDFFFRLNRDTSSYSSLLISLIYKAASQDNVILKGRGAQLILANQSHVLCVKLQGNLDVRVATIQKQRQLDPNTAKKLVIKNDRDRMGFVQYLFNRELTDIQSYDIVIDVGKLSQETITKMIVDATSCVAETYPMTEEEQKSLEILAFGSQVKAIIQKHISNIPELEVNVDVDGIVTIYGNVARKDEKTAIEQQVNSLPEVRGIVNNIKVGSPFRRRKRRA